VSEEKRILVVDDYASFREVISEILRDDLGYLVVEAATEADALMKLRDEDFHAVLIDLLLRNGSGKRVLHAVCETRGDHTPCIMTSGYSAGSWQHEVQALGAFGVIEKPSRASVYTSMLRAAVSHGMKARSTREMAVA
jgi:DNA-binding NtrC family response regulator